MAKKHSGPTEAFDTDVLRQLIKLMNDNDLAEIDIKQADRQVRLRKRGTDVVPVVSAASPMVAQVHAASAAAPTSAPEAKRTEADPAGKLIEIKSPMVGTFYRSSAPDAQPFVQVGAHIEADTIVCLVEAMKVFNEIPAEVRGKIVAVLVENAQPVEYGQPLFRVDPAG
jgi:acetyl-CoA carboxylase biotin carboxyl carrier protein